MEWGLQRIRTLISAPSFANNRENAAASLLHTSSCLTLLGASVFEVLQLYFGTEIIRVTAVAVVAMLAGMALWLLRRHQLRAAGWLVTATIFGIACASIWLGGGINAPGMVTLMIVLIMSAMTLEWQPTIAWTLLSIGALSGFAFAQGRGWLPSEIAPRPLIETWFIYAFHLAAAAWLVTSSAGAVRGILGALGTRTVELANSEERYEMLVEQSPDVIVAINGEGIIVECSQAIRSLFGYRPEDVIGRSFRELGVLPDASFDRNVEAFDALMTGKGPELTGTQVVDADGSTRWIEANSRVVRSEDGTVRLYLVIRDTTARVEAEQQRAALEQHLVAAGRLEALGRMSGALAHDFNNLLLVILSNTELLESDWDHDPEPLLKDIRVAGEAAANLTGQLLAFAGRQVQEVYAADVGESLSRIEGLLRRLLPSNVALQIHVEDGLPSARSDPSQLEQVIVNLVLNAQQVMPDGGMITIEASTVAVEEAECQRYPGASPGGHVQIAVTDTGPGIDEATARRIFEPFFTTRDGGTGLGLATVHGTVRQSGGHIRVHGRLGEGARFEVLLPHSQRPTASNSEALPTSAGHLGQHVVLLVDDDPAVQASVTRLLECRGFRVLTADGHQTARAVSDQLPAGIDILVSDVMIPGTSGPKLAAELLVDQPQMKVLLMSGYTEDYLDQEEVMRGVVFFIAKPFSGYAIAEKIRSLLREPESSAPAGGPAPLDSGRA